MHHAVLCNISCRSKFKLFVISARTKIRFDINKHIPSKKNVINKVKIMINNWLPLLDESFELAGNSSGPRLLSGKDTKLQLLGEDTGP